MTTNSKIEWTHHTFNPWVGCTKVSPACDHCYAEADVTKKKFAEWGPNAPRRMTTSVWKDPPKWNRQAQKLGVRYRVFCGSWCDVFEARKDTLDALRRLFDLVEATPSLDWLLLTKRPHNVMKLVPDAWRDGFPDNVWIGSTVENQEWATRRVEHLIHIPAKYRFVSVEPMFSSIDLRPYLGQGEGKINWVINGGESGIGPDVVPLLRGSDETIAWYRDLRDQCVEADVPYFFKQWGNFKANGEQLVKLRSPNSDKTLDGRTWQQFPGEPLDCDEGADTPEEEPELGADHVASECAKELARTLAHYCVTHTLDPHEVLRSVSA